MDNIDKALHYAATGMKLVEPVGTTRAALEKDKYLKLETEPVRIYAALDTLRINSPYYFLQWWSQASEFQRSKLTRSNFIPKTESDDAGEKVEIEIHNIGLKDPDKVSDSPTEEE